MKIIKNSYSLINAKENKLDSKFFNYIFFELSLQLILYKISKRHNFYLLYLKKQLTIFNLFIKVLKKMRIDIVFNKKVNNL